MRVVCTVLVLGILLICFPERGLFEGEDGHSHGGQDNGHGHGDHDQEPFYVVNKYLLQLELTSLENGQEPESIGYGQAETVVHSLLERFECSERLNEEDCEKCAESLTSHIFVTTGIDESSGLSEEDFEKASVILFRLLSLEEIRDTCSNTSWADSIHEYAETVLDQSGDTPDTLTEEELESILDEMSHSYHPSSTSKCFNVESVFENGVMNHEDGATEEELFHISTLIVSYLFQGYCIGAPKNVDPQEFTDYIFSKYGHDGVISEAHFEEILTLLSIGGAVDDGHGHEDVHDHAKRSIRSRDSNVRLRRGHVDNHTDEHGDEHAHGDEEGLLNITTTCFSGEQLLDIHGVDHEIGITVAQFGEMCPALIQQILSESCSAPSEGEKKDTTAAAWLYGTLAVFIVSLGAIFGLVIIPCLPVSVYDKFIHGLIALAVAVLAGDAIIHLLPLATGIHGHEAGVHVVHSPLDPELAYAWKSLACLLAIYFFYLLESLMGWWSGSEHTHPTDIHMAESGSFRNGKAAKSTSEAVLTEHTDATSIDISNGRGNCLTRYGPIPMMVIIGDGLHNFGDGLAIGAAFSAGLGAGVSTSIAVFCHEVPHELGDLAILLKSGLKFKWALILNFLSALTAFAGLYLGIILASTEVARQWIFAITAGMFLYVALADMMPQITHIRNVKDPLVTFMIQNVLFLIGTAFIFVIALYEDAINVTF